MKFLYLISLMVLGACDRSADNDPHFNLAKHLTVYHTTQTPAVEESQEASIPIINAEQFDKLVKSPQVLMEFYAPWCQACKELAPELVELHKRHPDLPIYKINVDDQVDLAKDNAVALVPTLILFRHGHRVAALSGYYDLSVIERFLQSDYL